MFFEAAFCSLLICFFSPGVSFPPFAARSACTCWLMAACWLSRLAVSPAVNCPLFTPFAMRSCWFSLRSATVGGFGAVDDAGLDPPVGEPVEEGSCPSAALPSSSTVAGNTHHFAILLMTVSPCLCCLDQLPGYLV